MRSDYFKAGPPWKVILKDKKEFTSMAVFRDREPPLEYRVPGIKNHGDNTWETHDVVFKLVGRLGNVLAYEEK